MKYHAGARLLIIGPMKQASRHILLTLVLATLTIVNAGAQVDLNERVLTNAVDFIDTPYRAHTLDIFVDHEELVANCDEVDCITFVEYVMALTLAYKPGEEIQEWDFLQWLRQIRYRDGEIDGYSSRLHYITDWAENGIRGGWLADITAQNRRYKQTISLNYMSTHPELYPQLAASNDEVSKMREVEQRLIGTEVVYLPEDDDALPHNGLPWIKGGDILAFTTDIPGLDVAHMGIALYVDGKLTMIHASSVEKKVTVSRVSVAQMLANNSHWTGIRVFRLKSE